MTKFENLTVKDVNYILDKSGYKLDENVVGYDAENYDFGLTYLTYTKHKYIGLYNGKLSEILPDIIGQAVSFNFYLGLREGEIDGEAIWI